MAKIDLRVAKTHNGSNRVILEGEISRLKKQREELTKELKSKLDEYRRGKLYENTHLQRKILDLIDRYNDGDFKFILDTCQAVSENIGAYRRYTDPKSPVEAFSEIVPPPLKFPREFLLEDVDILKGVPIVVGAFPGVGKSLFGVNIALDIAVRGGKALIFSLEMTIRQTWMRLYTVYKSKYENVKYSYPLVDRFLRVGTEEKDDMINFAKRFMGNIKVIDASGMSATQICGMYERFCDQFDGYPDWTIIDYIQRIADEPGSNKYDMRQQMMARSNLFANKGKTTGTTFLLVSQLSNEGRFKESGAINEDAGMSIKLTRELEDETGEYMNEMEIRITKNRFGRLGWSKVHCDGATGTIGNMNA